MTLVDPAPLSLHGVFRHPGAGADQPILPEGVVPGRPKGASIVADPTTIPPALRDRHSVRHERALPVDEHSPSARFLFFAFNDPISGPMTGVRERDPVSSRLDNRTGNPSARRAAG